MGITSVSAKLTAASKAASPLQAPEGDAGADFSALLTGQLTAPQLLGSQLQSLVALPADAKPNAVAAQAADDSAGSQDAASLLAAAGILPFLKPASDLPAVKAPQAKADAALPAVLAKSDKAAEQAPGLERIANAIDGGDQKAGKEKLLAAIAGSSAEPETANIAAEKPAPAANAANAADFAATLAAQSAVARQAQAGSEPASAAPQIATPFHDGRWAQDFGDKVVWLAKNDQQTAQLSINPPQLGPVHITLNLSGDQASAMFASPHSEVRQAIADAMPQLREMLAGAGINLGQANVGTQLPQQQQSGNPQQSSNPPRFAGDNAILPGDSGHGATALPAAARGGRGMVDLFA